MENLHSDKDLIVKTFGQMKNPFSLISADGKKEKDRVPIIDTPSAPETVNQGNVFTPINNNHRNGSGNKHIKTNGGSTLVTPIPNHPNHQNNNCQTPFIEMLTEDDLNPTPPDKDSSEDDDEEDGSAPLPQEDEEMEPHNLVEEGLGSSTPTNDNESVSTTNQEGNGENNIIVIQMVGDLQQDARTPIMNPYSSSSSSNTTRRTGREQNQNQNRKFQDVVFDKDDNKHNEEVIAMVLKDLNLILPATMVLYQKYREHIIAKQANVTTATFLKNMQMRPATMLTAEALVEERNILAPILGKICQDKLTHTL
eukprot:13247420-Ditylum_brightwellii.AAC.1